MGGFAQAGQSCISVQRVVVHASIYDDFRARLVAHVTEKIKTATRATVRRSSDR
jgi:acyl-CoA reductase-like NAD-dependent aldehyde dehydrogenase